MRCFLLLLFFLVFCSAFSDKIKKVEGEYTYYAPENVTIEEAKRIAIDRAKIQALADAFGTIVSQTNTTRIENGTNGSNVDFLSVGGSDVKGEWIETIGEPSISITYDNGMLVIRVSIKGHAKEITAASIDIQTTILCNGIDDKAASNDFHDGDDLYLSFLSPVNGYLSIYLADIEDNVYCLLPYRGQKDGIYKVEANQRYLFFNEACAPHQERAIVDEYTMTCSRSSEQNSVYILFSPNPYTKAADNALNESLPRELSFEKFNKWLQNIRKRDDKFQCRIYSINVSKK